MALTDDDVREILRIIDESELDELLVETDGFLLHVRKQSAGAGAASLIPRVGGGVGEGAPPPADPRLPSVDGQNTITSPMLGTFYRAQSPGAAPFVEVGARMQPDTTVCIIEVMKMMNSVPAGVSGTITEVCAQNAQLVEYGEPLFHVTPE